MSEQKPSWGVVMTVDEPAPLVLANVAWHLETGAERVHVYLDRPGDPLTELLAVVPQVEVTVCDAAWWAAMSPDGERPASQIRRQSINANHAYGAAAVDWLCHLDADEFLWQHRPLWRELRHLSRLDCEINVPVVERYFRPGETGLFEGGFRRSTKGFTDFDPALFGRELPFLTKGLLGHAQGKSLVPTGEDIEVGIHWSFRGKRGPEYRLRQYQTRTLSLLHFDGLTALHFAIKVLRYAMHDPKLQAKIFSEHRRNQVVEVMQNCLTLADILDFHDRLKVLDQDVETRFVDLGLAFDLAFDPGPAVAARFGKLDLSAAAFDAALRERYPEVFAFLKDRRI